MQCECQRSSLYYWQVTNQKSAVVIFLAGAMAYCVVFTSKVQATDANSNTGVYSYARNGWIVMLMWHVLSY